MGIPPEVNGNPPNDEYRQRRYQEFLSRPDIIARVRTSDPSGFIVGIALGLGELVQRVARSPHSLGYEPFFVKDGAHPILARALAMIITRRGKRVANDNKRRRPVIEAIRFLAKPGHTRSAVQRKAQLLLVADRETTIFQTIFAEAPDDEDKFLRTLEAVVRGEEQAHQQITMLAAGLVGRLPARRGLTPSAASISHEFLLEGLKYQGKPAGYTWNEVEGKCTDAMAEATRLEYTEQKFDPRPAHRRRKNQK